MTRGDILPWKRAGLSRWQRDERPFESFRREIEALHRYIDRLFDDLSGEGESLMLPEFLGRREVIPQLDVAEDEKAFRVKVELPGMEEKDVDVTLADRVLTIKGEKKEEKEEREREFHRRERGYGYFRRSIEIPAAVDADKIAASFHNGVMTIELPKTKEAQQKVKHIQVRAA